MTLFLSLIDRAPKTFLFLSVMLIFCVCLTLLDRRTRLIAFSAVVLAPLLPIFAIRLIAICIVIGCDWLTKERWLTKPAHYFANRLQDEFGI